MKKNYLHILIVLLALFHNDLSAQKYFVSFTDKSNNGFSINSPEEFLSQRAIERRIKQDIEITQEDLPVTKAYLDSLTKMGVKVLWPSKWLNGAIIESDNSNLTDTISRVSFISDSKLIWKSTNNTNISKFISEEDPSSIKTELLSDYGQTYNQTITVNGNLLHQNGYTGNGMLIAVIDNGFGGADYLPAFNHLWNNNQIVDAIDIVNPGNDVYNTDFFHGMYVLSVLAGYIEDEFIGAAPDANYILLRTEDSSSEYPIEEYNWVIAAEYADSAGVDIINSSLGYYEFNDTSFNYSYSDMDGKTTVCVKGAETAFSKGILVVNSAGNEGQSSWKYIISPSDGENILSVAAMSADSTRASFSSYGPSSDRRVKPDLTGLGVQTAGQGTNGNIVKLYGTSFSAPIISGFASCLWEAKPELSNRQLLQILRKSGHQYYTPDDSFGYGIPNFYSALDINSSVNDIYSNFNFKVGPNPFHNKIEITNKGYKFNNTKVFIYDLLGNTVYNNRIISSEKILINDLEKLSTGIYVLQLVISNQKYNFKIIKNKQ